MNIEQYLFGYLDAKRELSRIEAEQELIRQELMPKSPAVTGMPSSHSSIDRMAEGMIKLDELQSKWLDRWKKCCDKMDVIDTIINKVDDVTLRQILTYRYIIGYKWETIADKMNFTSRHIYRLKESALAEVSRLYDDCK